MDKSTLIYYAITLFLAFAVEAFVEHFIGAPMDRIIKLKPYKWLLMYISLGIAVGLSFHYKLDLPALVLEEMPTWVGMVLTGSLIGRGAGFVNDVWQKFLVIKKPPIPWYDVPAADDDYKDDPA